MTSRRTINQFLDHKRLAIVGVSRDAAGFSRAMLKEFEKRGYDVAPVNPATMEIDGKRCFARVSDIEPPVEAALLMIPADRAEEVVRDCASAHVNDIWLHRGGGQGAVSPEAVKFCHEHDMNVVEGECPLMFLPKTAWFHRAHGLIKKITGSYPN